jgi:hypothetical protein
MAGRRKTADKEQSKNELLNYANVRNNRMRNKLEERGNKSAEQTGPLNKLPVLEELDHTPIMPAPKSQVNFLLIF